jgi:Spy/CpxP family protein refolding chaperone
MNFCDRKTVFTSEPADRGVFGFERKQHTGGPIMKFKFALLSVALFTSGIALAKGPNGGHGNCGGSGNGASAHQGAGRVGKQQGIQRLNLSDEQKAKIEAMRAEHRKAVQSGGEPSEKGAMREQIRTVLTPEQQKQLDEIHAARPNP